MNYQETKKRKFKLESDLDRAKQEVEFLEVESKDLHDDMMSIYRKVQDFTVDHTTTVDAIKKMKQIKTEKQKVDNKIKSRNKKIKELQNDLNKLS